MLTFCNQSPYEMNEIFRLDEDDDDAGADADAWETDPARAEIVAWLTERGIPHQECFGIGADDWVVSYKGFLFVDIRYDVNAQDYREFAAFIEDENGVTRLPGVGFVVLVHSSTPPQQGA